MSGGKYVIAYAIAYLAKVQFIISFYTKLEVIIFELFS